MPRVILWNTPSSKSLDCPPPASERRWRWCTLRAPCICGRAKPRAPRHSSAHILGEALENLYGARLTHGPPTDNGFFYDSYLGGSSYAESMKATVEKKVGQTNWPQPSPQLRRKPPLQP